MGDLERDKFALKRGEGFEAAVIVTGTGEFEIIVLVGSEGVDVGINVSGCDVIEKFGAIDSGLLSWLAQTDVSNMLIITALKIILFIVKPFNHIYVNTGIVLQMALTSGCLSFMRTLNLEDC